MDTGAKSLAQLSEEGKETKYVTLDTGAKISGYTKDYLERLCLLNKVEYRLWSNGNFVIELDSLLRETQAILLSYEGLTFVDKNELTDPVPQVVGNILSSVLSNASPAPVVPLSFEDSPAFKSGIAQSVPTFGKTISEHATPVSFIGRAVVSDALHPEEKVELKKEPVKIVAAVPVVTPQQPTIEIKKPEEAATHVPIAKFNMSAIHGEALLPAEAAEEKTVAEKVHERIPVVAVNSHDDWDKQLLGAHLPIEATHHIPVVKVAAGDSTQVVKEPEAETVVHAPTHLTVEKAPSLSADSFTPPSGQKVVVFSSNEVVKETAKEKTPEVATVTETKEIAVEAPALPLDPTPISLIASAPHVPLPVPREIPLLTTAPILNTPPPKTELPIAAQAVLPMVSDEHHLTPYETHPLMRSTGFNMVFAAMLIATSFVSLGGKVLENVSGKLNTAEYVAGVGAALGGVPATSQAKPADEKDALKKGERAMLPFSNDVVATSGEKANSIIIRPVFESGEGKAYEYILVPESTSTPSR